MATSYYLDIDVDCTAEQMVEYLAKLPLIAFRADTNPYFWTDAGLVISVIPMFDEMIEIMEEEFHFRPTVGIGFRMRGENYDVCHLEMISIVMDVLSHFKGDAVLMLEGEEPRLLRIGGELTLDSADSFWGKEELALVTMSYTMRALPHI